MGDWLSECGWLVECGMFLANLSHNLQLYAIHVLVEVSRYYLRCGVIEVMYTPLLLCMYCTYYRGVSPVSLKPYTSVSEEVKHG